MTIRARNENLRYFILLFLPKIYGDRPPQGSWESQPRAIRMLPLPWRANNAHAAGFRSGQPASWLCLTTLPCAPRLKTNALAQKMSRHSDAELTETVGAASNFKNA